MSDALNPRRFERPRQFKRGLAPGRRLDDDLRHHRIEFDADLAASLDAGIDSNAIALRRLPDLHHAGRRQKILRGILSAKPRLERLTNRFGALSIFLSKYIYGLRWASCTFYGVARMPFLRFLPLSMASCFLWVFILSGVGYFFSSAVTGLIGDFRHVGKILLGIVIGGVVGFYFLKRMWISRKVEEATPERLQEIEKAAIGSLKELKEEIREKIHLK